MSQLETSAPEQTAVLLGDGGVGKTTLVAALRGREFDSITEFTHDIVAEPFDDAIGGSLVDLGGQQIDSGFAATLKQKEPSVAIFVVDARNPDTYESRLEHWNSHLLQCDGYDGIEKHLVITKCDERPAHVDEYLLAEKYGFAGIHSTSSKTGSGIQELRSAIRDTLLRHTIEDSEVSEVALAVRIFSETLCEAVAKNPSVLRELEWRDLERLLSQALATIGFSVELTRPAKDGGKDIVVECVVERKQRTYYIEVKHWRSKSQPGTQHVTDFVEVNARDRTDGGLFVSSSGFTDAVYSRIGELSKQQIRLGDEEKIVSLCQHYIKTKDGLWRSKTPLPNLLFEHTLDEKA